MMKVQQKNSGAHSHKNLVGYDGLGSSTKHEQSTSQKLVGKSHQKQIHEEIVKIVALLQRISLQLTRDRLKGGLELGLEQMRQTQYLIQAKEKRIEAIQGNIINLKNRRPETRGNPTRTSARMHEQLTKNADKVAQLAQKLQKKQLEADERMTRTIQVQKVYKQFCQKQGINMVNFQKFKQLHAKQKLKANYDRMSNKRFTVTSVSDEHDFNTGSFDGLKPTDNKTLKDYTARKAIADNALRNERKKHRHEIVDLLNKLQFLRDEEAQLEDNICAKIEELNRASSKFCETKRHIESLPTSTNSLR